MGGNEMDAKILAIAAIICIGSLLAIGVGYAYSSSLETTDNNAVLEDVTIAPVSGDNSGYVGSTKVIRYNSDNSSGTMSYGIAADASLTELTGIKLSYEGKKTSMPIYNISFTIDTDMFVNDGYEFNKILISLTKDGKTWTGDGPYVDQTMHTMRWEFKSTSDDGSTTITATSTPSEYNLTFAISKDRDGSHPHKAKLNTDGYNIIVRASTEPPEHYYLYVINNGHGDPGTKVSDDSNHKFTEPDALSETGYIFGGWYSDWELTTPFDFTAQATSDMEAFAKWTPEKYSVQLTIGSNSTVKSGELSQTIDYGKDMAPVVITANDGYYFPFDYTTSNDQALTVSRDSAFQITVTGNITEQKTLALTDASTFDLQTVAKSVSDKAFEVFYEEGKDLREYMSEENWWVYTGINCPKSTNRVAIGGFLFEKNLKTTFQVGEDRVYTDMYAWGSVDGKLYVAVPALYSLTNEKTGVVSIQVESTRSIDLQLFPTGLNEYLYTVEIGTYEGAPAKLAFTTNERSIVLATTDSRTEVDLMGETEYGFRFDEGFESFSMGDTPGMLYKSMGYEGWNDDQSMGNTMFTRYYKVVSNTGNYFDIDMTFIYARTVADYNAVVFDNLDSLTKVTVNAAYSVNFIDGLSQGLDLNGWDLYVGLDGSVAGSVNTYKSSSMNKLYYTIAFDSNGGSEVDPIYIVRKAYAYQPQNPVKDDCTFLGWFTDPQCTKGYGFDVRVTESMTLYAKWGEA